MENHPTKPTVQSKSENDETLRLEGRNKGKDRAVQGRRDVPRLSAR